MNTEATTSQRKRIVVIGGGFGGLALVRRLKRASSVEITLIDRRNFHLFQPLLYQVATGGLSPANIAAPLRSILRRQKNAKVLLGEVQEIDLSGKQVLLSNGSAVPYDYWWSLQARLTITLERMQSGARALTA